MRAIAALGLAALSLCGAAVAIAAHAADLAPNYPAPPVFNEPDAQYQFGTGWYLRGDASFGPEDQPGLGLQGYDAGRSHFGWGVGAGAGYKFNSFLRADVTGDYFDPWTSAVNGYPNTIPANGDAATVAVKAGVQRYDGLVNLYADLGTWYGLSPYIGAGVGVGVINPTEKDTYTDTTSGATFVVNTRSSSRTNLAWAAMAGLAYQIDPSVAVDLGYRHLDLGHFSTTTQGYTINHNLTADEVRLGVRYMLN